MPNHLPVVSPAVLEKGLRAEMYAAYQAAEAFWPQVALRIPSRAQQETYGWMGSPPAMREWTDQRVPSGLLDHRFTIINKDWEASVAIDRNALEDDQTGQIALRVRELGERAKRHPDELITQLLEAGESRVCYDGRFFFDTDHVEGDSGTQSNKLTYDATSPTSPNTAEFSAAFRAARKALRGFKDDRGKHYNYSLPGLMCMVPPSMETVAEEVLNSQMIASTSNVLSGAAELMVNPILVAEDKFYLLITGNALRPMIFQERRGVTAASLKEDGEGGFFRKAYFFGVDARYNVGFGLWQYAVQMKFV